MRPRRKHLGCPAPRPASSKITARFNEAEAVNTSDAGRAMMRIAQRGRLQ